MKVAQSPNASAGKRMLGPILLLALLAVLFWKCFLPDYVHFSNDGPLAQQMSAWLRLPWAFTGQWYDVNSIGFNAGAAAPSVTCLVRALGPVGYAKFMAPTVLWLLGLCAWYFFRQLRFSQLASILGGFAAALTSTFFSDTCWGLGPHEVAVAMDFFALGLIASNSPQTPVLQRWLRIILAGLAVGMNVVEAADIGAFFSMLIAAFVFFYALIEENGSGVAKGARGIGRTILVASFALFIAAQAISSLIGVGIKGIAGTEQTPEAKAARWDFATQWSMPKKETLGLVVPGLFGYGLGTPNGANYWGTGGQDAAWERYFANDRQGEAPDARRFIRHTGSGNYQGVLVLLLALWAVFQSLRRRDSVFAPVERKLIWFWGGAVLVSLLLAFGRHAPFYQFLYQLPYFSTIRNPIKFLNLLSLAMVTLFAYGVDGLYRRYLTAPLTNMDLGARWKLWWSKAAAFDKRWIVGSVLAIIASIAGWAMYAASRAKLEQHLQTVQFDEDLAHKIAGFSIQQVGWFVLFLTLGSGLLALILCGAFAGRRMKTAGVLLGLVLVSDFVRSDVNWITFWNYKYKYEVGTLNPVVDFLRKQPYEHRVAQLPFRAPDQFSLFGQVYGIEWSQQLFPFYNIQSLDIIQSARTAVDVTAYEQALFFPSAPAWTRRWELTNTRYLLGPAGFLDVMNQQIDPSKHRFRIITTFEVVPKPGVEHPTQYADFTARVVENGPYALFEFTGALPRAKLFTQWQTNNPEAVKSFTTNGLPPVELEVFQNVGTNDFLTLKQLTSPTFDPWQTVLLSEPLAQNTVTSTNASSGTVEYESYAPKVIKLKATAAAPSVLLLNDKYDPNWHVYLDGKRVDLLRCNYIMRGVYLSSAGEHKVEFRFEPPIDKLYVSIAACVLAVAIMGYLVTTRERKDEQGQA